MEPKRTTIFNVTLIPNGIEGTNLRFSACFDLDRGSERYKDGQADPQKADKWRQQVAEFHTQLRTIHELIDGNVKLLNIDGGYDPDVDPQWCFPDEGSQTLWTDFLGLRREVKKVPPKRDYENVKSRHLELITAQTAVKRQVTDYANLVEGMRKNPVAPLFKVMPRSKRMGIERAFEKYKKEIAKRREGTGELNMKAISARSGSKEAPKDKGEGKGQVSALDVLREEGESLEGTPEYVATAFETLNCSPKMRRALGTILDLQVNAKKILDTLPQGEPGKMYTVTFILDNIPDPLKQYFNFTAFVEDPPAPAPPQKLNIRLINYGPFCLFTAEPLSTDNYGDHYKGSLMDLKGSFTLCYEPQGIAHEIEKATEAAASLDTKIYGGIGDVAAATAGQRSLGALRSRNRAGDHQTPDVVAQASFDFQESIMLENVRLTMSRRLNAQVSNTSTKGHSLYKPKPWVAPSSTGTSLFEHDVVSGYAVYVRHKNTNEAWMSLTQVSERLSWKGETSIGNNEKDAVKCEIVDNHERGIQIGGGVHCDEGAGGTESIGDGFLFLWDGTGLSLRNPLKHYDRNEAETFADEAADRIDSFREEMEINHPEVLALQYNTAGVFGIDWFPFTAQGQQRPTYFVERSWYDPQDGAVQEAGAGGKDERIKLKFSGSTEYEYLLAAQYHNGYVPLSLATVNRPDIAKELKDLIVSCRSRNDEVNLTARFQRFDHIKDPVVCFEENIYDPKDPNVPLKQYLGESPVDLVVRSGELLNDGGCLRYILPPPIPGFNTYLWYTEDDLRHIGHPIAPHDDEKINGSDGKKLKLIPRTLDDKELATWYYRYSCSIDNEAEFQREIAKCKERNEIWPSSPCELKGCKAGCKRFCGGVKQEAEYDDHLRYLPDPIVTGMAVMFFVDAACTLAAPEDEYPTQFCSYAQGKYPNLIPWGLYLEKDKHEGKPGTRVRAVRKDQVLRVRLRKGARLYAKVIPTYDADRAHFGQPWLADPSLLVAYTSNTLAGNQMGVGADRAMRHFDLLFSNAKVFSLTHAVQRPLVEPEICSLAIKRFNERISFDKDPGSHAAGKKSEAASVMEIEMELRVERLDRYFDGPTPQLSPTGELELYALWEEYGPRGRGPLKRLKDKRKPNTFADGFQRIARLIPVGTVHCSDTSEADPTHQYDRLLVTFRTEATPFNASHCTPAIFKVRNASMFQHYFTSEELDEKERERFSRWSMEWSTIPNPNVLVQSGAGEPYAIGTYVFNNKRPEPIRVRKIVPLIVTDEGRFMPERTDRGNRVRIYIEPDGRMSSGFQERIGIVVYELYGMHHPELMEHISKAGVDAITDGVASSPLPYTGNDRLQELHFVRDPSNLEEAYTSDSGFAPRYDMVPRDQDQGEVGLVSYKPLYDPAQGLWFVDVEMDLSDGRGEEVHNAFVRLGLITFQPCSAIYRDQEPTIHTLTLQDDMRLSSPVMADFFSIYPSRHFKYPAVLFRNRDGNGFTLSGATRSLFRYNDELRSQFYLVVKERCGHGLWQKIRSTMDMSTRGFKIDGQAHDYPAEHGTGEDPRFYHALLPYDSGPVLGAGNQFECALDIWFGTDWLHWPKDSGNYQAVIYEVEWFNYEPDHRLDAVNPDTRRYLIDERLEDADPPQIPGMRVKGTYTFEGGKREAIQFSDDIIAVGAKDVLSL